ncbi:hypothetical protein HPB49_004605 [Dermacentor silvarum]|uniref:Uncharacterized protein n=1 Tax=Dermacentor silvarum TaxID=543639 RepID=A0ACB8DUD0_DERSI|nr:hypothetical protein HPB49_004605 [Dermacentor silvarum]
MNTRFGHLNPDRRNQPMMSESGDGNVEDHSAGAVASEGQRETDLRSLADQRRVLELEVELARLRQNGSGCSRESGHAFGGQVRCGELRRHSKCLAGVLPKFPSEAEAPVRFESIESSLEAYEVPRGFCGQIVFPLVAEKVPFRSTLLSPAEHKDYSKIMETVLDELKLSAGEYLKRFLGSGKRMNERWRPYATRLQSYLHFYLDSRGVSTFEELVKLLVAYQLKKSISDYALRYVTLQEGKTWLKAPDLAALLRTFEEAQGKNSARKQVKHRPAESQSASSVKPGVQPEKQQPAATLSMGSSVVERVLAMTDVILRKAPDVPNGRKAAGDVVFPDGGVVERRSGARCDMRRGEIIASSREVKWKEVPLKHHPFITEASGGWVPSCEKHLTPMLQWSADVGVPLATAVLRKADEDDKRVLIEVLARASMTPKGGTCRAALAVPIVAVTQCALEPKGSTKIWKRSSREENFVSEQTICLTAPREICRLCCGLHPFDPGG